jgi:hypothetical protein
VGGLHLENLFLATVDSAIGSLLTESPSVWVEICLLAWRYFGNYSLELHDIYVE